MLFNKNKCMCPNVQDDTMKLTVLTYYAGERHGEPR